ncbi:hypothetical protein [Aequorivita sp. KMM 9714]|uniref:hypothetical protein n=1 Tax=Aequorivita sp. KMM 9714 TaxID=2707173 RepID=UPI0013EE132B|nr:hypothetical protein [Aequorivita sp. KMM 9714]NGX85290.1 hypothetical protein [Aequorivita sp. KMM 9714]
MKFDPITKEVYTDKGEFVKTLNCPYKMSWDKLEVINSSSRKCVNCDHLIIDTENLTDHNLLDIIKQNPQTCLKIDLNQQNIQIISNGRIKQQ